MWTFKMLVMYVATLEISFSCTKGEKGFRSEEQQGGCRNILIKRILEPADAIIG